MESEMRDGSRSPDSPSAPKRHSLPLSTPRFADSRLRAVVSIAGALFHPDFQASSLRQLPLLVVHGAGDTKNDRLRQAIDLYRIAQQPKELLILEGASHGICQDEDPRPHRLRVAEATTAFWNRYL